MSSQASQRSSSTSAVAQKTRERRKSKSRRRCWFGCLWLSSRVSLIRSSSRFSRSPEPDESLTAIDKVMSIINEKPLKMAHILKTARFVNDVSFSERKQFVECGVIHHLLELIGETAISDFSASSRSADEQKRRARRNSSASLSHKGTGYGTGSTRSRWDIERTVEEKLIREEHLTWLLSILNSFMLGWPTTDNLKTKPEELVHMTEIAIKLIADSSVLSILEYNLRNDSFFDVSEHIEIYQALLETAASMAATPGLVPFLVRPYTSSAKSIAKELIPRFKENILSIQARWGGTLEETNFRMAEFTAKVTLLSDYVINAARAYEQTLPPEQRIQTATHRRPSHSGLHSKMQGPKDDETIYKNKMQELQLQTAKFIGDFGKLCVPYVFRKEAKNINPFSPHLRDRTKRIAKELASIANALPLNASNSIYVCYDEGRVDIIKVLISGPDDTPYANGLFEFDIFFPTGYPFSPPKCAFLTTGSGNVRFNPNLYNDGKICLSILGTWEGRPEEKWNPYCSLMQVLVSIQGLIFVKDPYFNEPGFERYQGTDRGDEYSRKYNLQIEHATLNYAIREQLKKPSEHFKEVIEKHLWLKREAILKQAQAWIDNVSNDFGDDKMSKRKDVFAFETGFNPATQERVIHNLIQELQAMQSPFAKEEAEESERLKREQSEKEEKQKKEAAALAEIEREKRELELDFQRRRSSVLATHVAVIRTQPTGDYSVPSVNEPSTSS
ncbi:putative ubiquitin-conjugating enzyme protein 17 [Caenorhabditis elegans]|uniref:Probable ubiquitin-conjugating enzyme protein 17 n=1 Tax=Caenorhabditis elegans TaxID=6239 RepID=UBC17_CAEEL|nr:putative ubiquitin-conjugating enzyme protein 17 [Caenorhabditis elegans]Q11076.3 RecName: Full=Probable ubiquitin-conjugating enzyme protein 17 [Caenorhabditis elegans]CCD61841.3 Probable ubiquitin-conjugating enzyme protein 17 [Caenorhabditis elegans]|eukprot:NP_509188.3 Probable ubiquitin-conjugating enzyme protein 17 [Caenorhabditis elegans]